MTQHEMFLFNNKELNVKSLKLSCVNYFPPLYAVSRCIIFTVPGHGECRDGRIILVEALRYSRTSVQLLTQHQMSLPAFNLA